MRILILQGHPAAGGHFCHALADAYAAGAAGGGHELRRVDIAGLDFPLLRDAAGWEGPPPPALAPLAEAIRWAQHIVIVYPLWLGDMPALLKGVLEQVFRPAFIGRAGRTPSTGALKGRSARIVVTMGMPALLYRWFFRAHSVRSLQRNILGFVGIAPARVTLIGAVEASAERRARWLADLRAQGARGG